MAKKAPHRKIKIADDGTRTIEDRAANGEGGPWWDESKQRWRAPWRDPVTLRRRTCLGRTKAEAVDRAAAALEKATQQAPTSVLGPNPTMAVLCDWFLDHVIVGQVRPGTYATYTKHCRVIVDRLGTTRILDLSVERVRLFMSDLRDAGHKPTHISNVRARLRQVVEEAVNLGYLTANPVSKVAAPAVKRDRTKPRSTLTPAQVGKLIEATFSHDLGAAVAIMFLLGNRAAEALGLAWSDIDLDAAEPTAHVQRGSTYVPPARGRAGGQMLGPTKTQGTAGTLRLPPSVVALLRKRHAEQAIDRAQAGMAWATIHYDGTELDMVFTDHRGRLIGTQRLYDAVLECCTAAGITDTEIGTRTGRRSVITGLFDAGLELADVQRFIGHTDSSTTAGYVQHLAQRPKATTDFAHQLLDPAARN